MMSEKAKVEAKEPGNEALALTQQSPVEMVAFGHCSGEKLVGSTYIPKQETFLFFFFLRKKEAIRGRVLIKDKVEDLDPYQLVSPWSSTVAPRFLYRTPRFTEAQFKKSLGQMIQKVFPALTICNFTDFLLRRCMAWPLFSLDLL